MVEFSLYRNGDIIFALEHIVEFHFWDFRANHIKNIRSDLIVRVFEFVEGLVDFGFNDLKLNRYFETDKDVILGLCLHQNIQLLNFKVYTTSDSVNHRNLKSKPRGAYALKPPKALNDNGSLLFDDENEGPENE